MKKILVVLVAMAMIFSITMVPNDLARANSSVEPREPDFVTSSILILDPEIVPVLIKGTLSVVSFISENGKVLGFEINRALTNLIVAVKDVSPVKIGQPVALILKGSKLEIYLSNVNIIECEWRALSISSDYSDLLNSYFPVLFSAQIVKGEQVGVEREINYCCTTPLVNISYDYILYLATGSRTNPFDTATKYDSEISVIIPENQIDLIEEIIKNKDYIWIGISSVKATPDSPYENTKIYIWH